MKKVLIYISLLFYCLSSFSQIINFPDPIFKSVLLLQAPPSFYDVALSGLDSSTGDPLNNAIIDTNGDGEITEAEAAVITGLNIRNSLLTNMIGIEKFVNLRWLTCWDNNNLTILNVLQLVHLKTLAINNCPIGNINFNTLSNLQVLDCTNTNRTVLNADGLTNLRVLACEHNQIASVNISTNSNLSYIFCKFNNLTQINTSNLPLLKSLYCDFNQLTTLDLGYNPLFKNLSCGNNNLITLKIKNNSQELFGGNFYGTERWNGNPNLNYICADNAEILALQAYLASSNITQPITIDSNCVLANDKFVKNEVGIFPNPATNILNIETKENILSINIYNTLGQMVLENVANKIDISSLTAGTYFIKITTETGTVNKKFIKSE